ncbi:hypothetical protein HRG_010752 [Hirsutella rhossiliensis]|uniref:Phosphatidylglycerol/phosphatidylinositol transfer protein n=1 Tax=Hirsutella rhossiliensis TaxID=111463 RepID=A0A9P8MN72_9HYPO|nr:uncharacterized protein HRG_10752 [Hirsutella rhossiliensis]KAH0958057.1 hypothetical protein HRG_10752 [Hirsutella rhossiliensis]
MHQSWLPLSLLLWAEVSSCLRSPHIEDSPCLLEGQHHKDELDLGARDKQAVLSPSEVTTAASDAKVNLKSGQDYTVFYPQQEQAIWPVVRNKGPDKAAKLILESPDLGPLGISIASIYASCPGTRPGSPKIRCEWDNTKADFSKWSKITLKFTGKVSRHQPGFRHVHPCT